MSPVLNREPAYEQIANHLREQILSGALKTGDVLPSNQKLQEQYGVSKVTVARAMAALSSEGLTEGRVGYGTVVRGGGMVYRRVQDRYRLQAATGAFHAPGEGSRIAAAEVVTEVPANVREALGLPEGASAVRRHRITSRDGQVIEISTSWFAGELAKTAPALLSTERIPEGTPTLVQAATGRKLTHGCETTSVRLATDDEAADLERPTPLPVLVTEHTALDADGKPLTYEVGLCPPGYRTSYTYEV
jgi:DNA-binding GntR family transcriptional regulator